MKLMELLHRNPTPEPWGEGESIPWSDPAFSERMLREHLSQKNDRASRRSKRIALQVRWLHEELLASTPSRILDLSCGPGLYTVELAKLGHDCFGIDCAPAAIGYAQEQAEALGDRCRYLEADIRVAAYGENYDLCTFIFGELNSYRPADAEAILRRAYDALATGGRLVVETHTATAIEKMGAGGPLWSTAQAGLFSDEPNLVLKENIWDGSERTATDRWFIVDLATGNSEQITSTARAYSDDEYRQVFARAGFSEVTFVPSMGDPEGAIEDGLFTIIARR